MKRILFLGVRRTRNSTEDLILESLYINFHHRRQSGQKRKKWGCLHDHRGEPMKRSGYLSSGRTVPWKNKMPDAWPLGGLQRHLSKHVPHQARGKHNWWIRCQLLKRHLPFLSWQAMLTQALRSREKYVQYQAFCTEGSFGSLSATVRTTEHDGIVNLKKPKTIEQKKQWIPAKPLRKIEHAKPHVAHWKSLGVIFGTVQHAWSTVQYSCCNYANLLSPSP